jgi:hypothetical protein
VWSVSVSVSACRYVSRAYVAQLSKGAAQAQLWEAVEAADARWVG